MKVGALGVLSWHARDASAAARRHVQLAITNDASAEGCLSDKGVTDAVAERLGYSPFDADRTEKVLIASRKDGATAIATITFVNGEGRTTGTRTLVSQSDCDELTQAVAVTMALSLDPLAAGASNLTLPSLPPPDPTTTAPPKDAPAPEKEAPPAPRVANHEATTRAGWTTRVGILVGGDLGTMPSVSARGGLHLGVHRRAADGGLDLRLGLTASGFLPMTEEAPALASYTLRGGDLTIEALLGRHLLFGPIVRMGFFSGETRDDAKTTSHDWSLFTQVGLRAGYEWSLDRFFLRGQVDGAVTPVRSVVEANGREAWSMPFFSGGASLLFGATL